jgi:hypothetical protein
MSVEPLNNRIQQLERLIEVGRNLSAMLDLEPLLQSIIDVAADLTYSQVQTRSDESNPCPARFEYCRAGLHMW